MKRVCVITAARSEYGLLRWLLKELNDNEDIQLQLLVTGSHLSLDQGLTYKEIEKDGFIIDKKIEFLLSTSTSVGIAKSMGLCAISISEAFDDLSPDLIVVLGDRYELLPICSVALVMGIPIAHISGGDVTEGAIDDQIRNAVTMLSTLHFPGTEDSATRITRLMDIDKNVYVVGEPGLDNFLCCQLMNRQQLAHSLQLDVDKQWVLVTFHPETKESLSNNLLIAENMIETLRKRTDIQVVITQANADLGGAEINSYFKKISRQEPEKFQLYSSLGQLRYLSFMKEAFFVIGNSSSGIVEAPFLGKPVINIGNRQLGRHLCSNVVTVSGFGETIKDALDSQALAKKSPDYYYGDGMTSPRIATVIHRYLFDA